MTAPTLNLQELKEEVKLTQRLVIQTANNSEETSTEEWSFIEKKLSILFKHLSQHLQQDNIHELTTSERTLIKLIHQYYIEMVDLITTKKQSVSEELRQIGNRERVKSTYSE